MKTGVIYGDQPMLGVGVGVHARACVCSILTCSASALCMLGKRSTTSSTPAPSLSYSKKFGASKMSQWVKVLATLSDDLSSVPRIHTVQGENQVQKGVF